MEILLYIIILLIGGCFAGFMAGLLGIGGGIIITPIQYFLLTSIGIEPKIALTVTFATSIAVIGVTMANSSRQHYNNGYIRKKYLKSLCITSFIATILGALTSTIIDVSLLKLIFGILCIASTIVLVFIKSPSDISQMNSNELIHNIIIFISSFLTGLIGPAGGAILIPIFVVYMKYPLHYIIGLTSVITIPSAIAGVITYIILGWNIAGLPPYSLGYVNIIQFIFLTITSIPLSTYAAKLSKKVSNRKLKALQIMVICYIGLKMIGIF